MWRVQCKFVFFDAVMQFDAKPQIIRLDTDFGTVIAKRSDERFLVDRRRDQGHGSANRPSAFVSTRSTNGE